MSVISGLDRLVANDFDLLKGKNVGILCNQASVDSQFVHILEVLRPLHEAGAFRIVTVFGPQHGLYGHTQDNMIEWEGGESSQTDFRILSLYGEHREPTPEMLAGIELFVVDIPEVGSRYYTFQWTMAYCLKACGELGIPVLVLDRPNPINGVQTEGPGLSRGFESFVGLYSVPIRHAKTPGEMARFLVETHLPKVQLSVLEVAGWDRTLYSDEAKALWVMPSPNMPTVDTAVVYPGGCLLEATNLSEGRGTSRPFEVVGAPYLDGWPFAATLNKLSLPGVIFRPIQFQPTSNKHVGLVCEGVFVHVTDRRQFKPVLTYATIISETARMTGIHEVSRQISEETRFEANSAECDLPGFAWKLPPYEYVYDRMPIDILFGNSAFRVAVENSESVDKIHELCL